MVARNFYDVIVIGTQLGPLLTAAMLARRGFRVLVIAHDDLPWTYTWEDYTLQREPFMFSGAETMAVRRVLSELSLTQLFRRRTTTPEPFFQVVLPHHRINFTGDADLFDRELEREFPRSRREIDAFYTIMGRCDQELEKIFAVEKLTLPPETFFEKQEMKRAAIHNPFSLARGPVPPFADLPEEHPFRAAILGQVRWASDIDLTTVSPLQLVRLHAAWTGGTLAVEGGLDGLKELIMDRISTHSGDVRRDLRADRVVLRRTKVAGVRMEGSDEVTGCNFVVLGSDAHHLPELIDVQEVGRKLSSRLAQVRPTFRRYTLNLVVDSKVVPEGMARNVIYISDSKAPLSEENLLRIEICETGVLKTNALCIGAMLPEEKVEDRAYMAGVRERILTRVRWLVPFLDQHLIAVDSPYDGLGLQDIRGDRVVPLGDKWERQPSRMPTIVRVNPLGQLDVTGLLHRTGLKNLILACRQVVPGLGIEGEFLTALGAARIITKSDRQKRKFRREAWTKIDL